MNDEFENEFVGLGTTSVLSAEYPVNNQLPFRLTSNLHAKVT